MSAIIRDDDPELHVFVPAPEVQPLSEYEQVIERIGDLLVERFPDKAIAIRTLSVPKTPTTEKERTEALQGLWHFVVKPTTAASMEWWLDQTRVDASGNPIETYRYECDNDPEKELAWRNARLSWIAPKRAEGFLVWTQEIIHEVRFDPPVTWLMAFARLLLTHLEAA